jgi:hypothetical protein
MADQSCNVDAVFASAGRSSALPEMQEPESRAYEDRRLTDEPQQSGTLPIARERGRDEARRESATESRSSEQRERYQSHRIQPRPAANGRQALASLAVLDPPAAAPATALPHRRPDAAAQPRALLLAAFGLSLLVLFASQALLKVEWPWLSRWQQQDSYKLWSGAALALFIAAQWLLTIARVNGWSKLARALYAWHQRSGMFAPVALFAHSTAFGFGYLSLLSTLYLCNTALGLMSPRAFPRLRHYAGVWLSGHIALSVALAVLVVYHAWIALFFE